MTFNVSGEALSSKYLKESDLIDDYIGNRLWLWGRNNYGQLGASSIANQSSPIQTVSSGVTWKQISAGYFHTLGIKTDGTLWGWGQNPVGVLGTSDQTDRSSPIQTVSGGSNWKLVATGLYHSGAIKTDGSLWLWGTGTTGELGTNPAANQSSPVQTISSGTNWKQVSCGMYTTAAIKTDGTLWLWGQNTGGKLGDNTTTDRSSPVQTVAGGTNWKQVSCGNYQSAAIKTDGTLWLWGRNTYGELGTNNTTNYSSPVQTVASGTNWKQVSCGPVNYVGAIKTDGTLWMWGLNNVTLATNNQTSYSSPVQTVASGTNWKQVSCGNFGAAAVKTDGTLWTWGSGTSGQVGDNTTADKSSPVQTAAGGTNWKQVSVGRLHMGAVTFSDQQ